MKGVILAGGKSRRIGVNKALLPIGKESVIEKIIKILSSVFDDVVIISSDPEDYQYLGFEVFRDIIPGKGSLGGIYTGLCVSDSYQNFFVACDMPFLQDGLIRYMVSKSEGYDVLIPKSYDGFQPLHAIYSKGCIEHIERQIGENNLKIIDFFGKVKVRVITQDEISRFDPSYTSFVNINTRDEYKKALDIAAGQVIR